MDGLEEFRYLPIVSTVPQDLDMVVMFSLDGTAYKVPYSKFKTIVGGGATAEIIVNPSTNYVIPDYTTQEKADRVNKEYVIYADGHSLDVPASWSSANGILLDNTAGKRNFVSTWVSDGLVFYSNLIRNAPDSAAPTFISVVATNSNLITVTLNKELAGTANFIPIGFTIGSQTKVGSTVQIVPTIPINKNQVVSISNGTGLTNSTGEASFAGLNNQSISTSTLLQIYHYSSFTGTDNTAIGSYTPEIGNAWANINGTWKILTGNMVSASFNAGYAMVATNVGNTNYNITSVINMADVAASGLQLDIRVTDIDNYVAIFFASGGIAAYNVVNAAANPIGSAATYSYVNNSDYLVNINVNELAVVVKLNGTIVYSFTMPTTQSGTKTGVIHAGSGPTPGNALIKSYLVTE